MCVFRVHSTSPCSGVGEEDSSEKTSWSLLDSSCSMISGEPGWSWSHEEEGSCLPRAQSSGLAVPALVFLADSPAQKLLPPATEEPPASPFATELSLLCRRGLATKPHCAGDSHIVRQSGPLPAICCTVAGCL